MLPNNLCELYNSSFVAIVTRELEGWWQRIPLSAGRIELQPASLSFLYVESESLPFNDENLAFLYVSRVFCTIRFPDGGGLVLRRRREDLRRPVRCHLLTMIFCSQ